MSGAKADAAPDLMASPLANPIDEERALIGFLLMQPEFATEVVGAGVLPRHFAHYATRVVFEAIGRIVDDNVPHEPMAYYRAVVADLFRQQITDVTQADISALLDHAPLHSQARTASWHYYVRRIREGHARRMLFYKLRKAAEECGTGELEDIRGGLYSLLDGADVTMRPASSDRWTQLAVEIQTTFDSGINDLLPTGLDATDMRFQQPPRGSFHVIAARTSLGKTALATSIATTHVRAGRKVSFISVEMDRQRIGHRYLGAMTGVELASMVKRTLSDADMQKLGVVMGQDLPLCTDDHAKTWSAVRSRARQHARELGGLDYCFVDYLQLVDPERQKDENRFEALGRMSRGCKQLAQDLNCHVVALAQLNRGADERDEPRVSDIRECGDIEQDADLIWLLWRSPKDDVAMGMAPVRLKVGKNRYGPTGEMKLYFRAKAMQFMEMGESETVPEVEAISKPKKGIRR